MTTIIYIIAVMAVGRATGELVSLNCGDNATCIDNMAVEFLKSVRQQKTVKMFDVLTIEPTVKRQSRSLDGLMSNFFEDNKFTIDLDPYTVRLSKAMGRSDALELEVLESRLAKDVAEKIPKASSSKESDEEEKAPKQLKRRKTKKVLQAVIPLLFGMKSAGAIIFAMTLVTVLTLKAFLASKVALLVTMGMAMKKLYESYSSGVGLQNHPYLYSQYPIDFPSASSHAYSISGVSPQFASQEMYNNAGLAQHSSQEMFQQQDASAQQSQQAPNLQFFNVSRAAERWDGFRRRPMSYGTSRATSE